MFRGATQLSSDVQNVNMLLVESTHTHTANDLMENDGKEPSKRYTEAIRFEINSMKQMN
jgi:hypothetical protein